MPVRVSPAGQLHRGNAVPPWIDDPHSNNNNEAPIDANSFSVDESLPEDQLADQLGETSHAVQSLLKHRLADTRLLRSLWPRDTMAALQHLKEASVSNSSSDAGFVFDFFTSMQQQRMKERLTMEMVPILLEVILGVLRSPEADAGLTVLALRTLRSVNTKFRSRLEEGQRRGRHSSSDTVPSPRDGAATCQEALDKLKECTAEVVCLAGGKRNTVGEEARRLLHELPV